MPFGSDPFRDTISSISNLVFTNGRVTNAFRQRSLSGQFSRCIQLYGSTVGHQCLSAAIPFGTRSYHSHPVQALTESPMPFGSDPFRDKKNEMVVFSRSVWSPMPFGSDPFRDISKNTTIKEDYRVVTNAFRQRSLSGLIHTHTSLCQKRISHQCLSAAIPFGTGLHVGNGERSAKLVTNAFRQRSLSGPKLALAKRKAEKESPMPFGSDPFRDSKISESKLAMNPLESPMPFGSDPFRDRQGRC